MNLSVFGDQQRLTYISSVQTLDAVLTAIGTDGERERERERESVNSMISALLNDDDDDEDITTYCYIITPTHT